MARTHRNPDSLHERITQLARSTGAQVFAVNSAYTDEGDTGIGSEAIVSLKAPRVAVVWDEGSDPTGYGALWYTFERVYSINFTPVSIRALKASDLSKFNVIILPDGSGGAYQSALGKDGIDKLKSWTRDGGVLIGLGGAATMFMHKDVDLTSSRLVGSDDDAPAAAAPAAEATTPQTAAPKPAETKPKEKGREAAAKPDEKPPAKPDDKKPDATAAPKKKPTEPISVPGAAFRVRVNRDHYLAYGYNSDTAVVMIQGDGFFRASKDGANVITFTADGPLTVAGFTWPDNTEALLRGTSFLIDEPTGRGHVILFAEDPNYRFLWRAPQPFFLNAILLATALR